MKTSFSLVTLLNGLFLQFDVTSGIKYILCDANIMIYDVTVVALHKMDSGPLSQRSAIAKVQGGLDWIQTIFFF